VFMANRAGPFSLSSRSASVFHRPFGLVPSIWGCAHHQSPPLFHYAKSFFLVGLFKFCHSLFDPRWFSPPDLCLVRLAANRNCFASPPSPQDRLAVGHRPAHPLLLNTICLPPLPISFQPPLSQDKAVTLLWVGSTCPPPPGYLVFAARLDAPFFFLRLFEKRNVVFFPVPAPVDVLRKKGPPF